MSFNQFLGYITEVIINIDQVSLIIHPLIGYSLDLLGHDARGQYSMWFIVAGWLNLRFVHRLS